MIIRERLGVLTIISIIIFMASASAELFPHQQLTNYSLVINAENSSTCFADYVQYPDGSISSIINKTFTKNQQSFSINFNRNNFSQLGITCFFYSCSNVSFSGNYCINVTPSGYVISPVQTVFYVFFLLICLSLLVLSVKTISNNPYSEDKLKPSAYYEVRKKSKFQFYWLLFKKKFWIVGIFGFYISLFLFSSILNLIIYNLGMTELNLMLIYFNNVMAWGTIPFVLFWFVYILLFFFFETANILRYQFMGATRE